MDYLYVSINELITVSSSLNDYSIKASILADRVWQIKRDMLNANSQYTSISNVLSEIQNEIERNEEELRVLSRGILEVGEHYSITEKQVTR